MDVVKHINNMAVNVAQGEVDSLKAYIELKQIETALNNVKKIIQDNAIIEAQKHGSKSFEFYGAKITLKSNPGRWSFNGYQEHDMASAKLKAVEERMKDSYRMMLKGDTYLGDGGEVVPPAQYVEGAESISVSLGKE